MVKNKWQVILRTYCQRDYLLTEALYSLLMQPYPNLEIIVAYHVENKEDYEKTQSIVERFKTQIQIKEVWLDRNRDNNRSKLLNKALELIDGEYLSFLDDDDVYYPEFGKNLIPELVVEKSLNFVFGDCAMSWYRKYEDFIYFEKKENKQSKGFNKIKFLMDNTLPIHTFAIRTSIIGKERFDESIDYVEDWDFLTRLVSKNEFHHKYVEIGVCEYRRPLDKSNPTAIENNSTDYALARKHVLNKIYSSEYQISGEDIKIFSEEYYNLLSYSTKLAMYEQSRYIKLVFKLKNYSIFNKISSLAGKIAITFFKAIKKVF